MKSARWGDYVDRYIVAAMMRMGNMQEGDRIMEGMVENTFGINYGIAKTSAYAGDGEIMFSSAWTKSYSLS